MLKKGERVETLTKVVGQAPRFGVVVDVKGDGEFVEVEWDDGHTSTVSSSAVVSVSAVESKPSR